jgi:dihydroxy-acid dehydratase
LARYSVDASGNFEVDKIVFRRRYYEMRSGEILGDREAFSGNRQIFKALGYSDDDLERPIIGIANSWNTLIPGHFNLMQLADYVKRGIYRGGCTAVEFGVIGVCDGIAQGHAGMNFVLPSRELIANDIETMAQVHRLDGLVLMGSCDKIVPGMLMAAARLDIPCIHIAGGPMLGGVEFAGRRTDTTSSSEAVGMLKAGVITQRQFDSLEEICCSSCGSCSYYGTANTMCVLSEAMGMSLPGSALVPAPNPERIRITLAAGEAICDLVKKDISARRIITKKSIENAVRVCLTTSGSTNAVMHLAAVAYEAEIEMNVLEAFELFNRTTPVVAKVNPASKYDMDDFYHAGGVPRVMKSIMPLLNGDAMTSTSETLSQNLSKYKFKFEEDKNVIRDMTDCFSPVGGLCVLRGNLAPDTGISKPGAIDKSVHHFIGTARPFDSEEEAEQAIINGGINAGDVIVIRYEGPKGGPGMREMYKAMKYLNGLGLATSTAVVTDGRFSGTNNGCFVGHISPEAAEGGPIAVVNDGDKIEIDVIRGELTLHVSDEELRERLKKWKPKPPKFTRGYLAVYSKLVTSASKGALIKYD